MESEEGKQLGNSRSASHSSTCPPSSSSCSTLTPVPSENSFAYFRFPFPEHPDHCRVTVDRVWNSPWTCTGILTWHQHCSPAVLLDPARPLPYHPFPGVPWEGSRHCTTPGGTTVKCGIFSISHIPEPRREASRPLPDSTPAVGISLGLEGKWKDRYGTAQGPYPEGCLAYHGGACFEARWWTHTRFFQARGNSSSSPAPAWATRPGWCQVPAIVLLPSSAKPVKPGQHRSLTNAQYISSGPRRRDTEMFSSSQLYFPWLKKFCFGSCYPVEAVSQSGRPVQRENAHHWQRPAALGGEGRAGAPGPALRPAHPRPAGRLFTGSGVRGPAPTRKGQVGWEGTGVTGHLWSASESSAPRLL